MTRGGRRKSNVRSDSSPRTLESKSRNMDGRSKRVNGERLSTQVHVSDGERLQKVLAHAGVGSRRACENLIVQGRVSVDGKVITELGVRVDPKKQAIHVDGMRINPDENVVTLALNKPAGVVCSMNDPQGRQDLSEWVFNRVERIYHVGRLDTDTSGLIFLTNDGEISHRLTHPRYKVAKRYVATVEGRVPRSLPKKLCEGVELEDGFAQADSATVVAVSPSESVVELVIHEGRNRIVRRLLAELGYPVITLVRTQVGPIKLGDIRPGATRVIAGNELASLMKVVGL